MTLRKQITRLIQPTQKTARLISVDKLTVSYAPGQLIGGGCFAAVRSEEKQNGI